MTQMTEQWVDRYMQWSEQFRKDLNDDPEKAKAFLVRAGILEWSEESKNGVRLAEGFRASD